MRKLVQLLSVLLLVPACAHEAAPPPAVARAPEPAAKPAEVAKPAPVEEAATDSGAKASAPRATDENLVAVFPTSCEGSAPCAPPHDFAVAACKGRYPAMAIAMFEKHTPWQRLYLKAESLEAVNSYGVRGTPEPLVFGEEVIVLRDVGSTGAGSAVASSMDIDVLRWDGTCATVSKEMFVPHQGREVKNAPIEWRALDGYMRGALLKSKYVRMSYEAHKARCKEERSLEHRDPDPDCERIEGMLNDSITVAVRGGIQLPVPLKLPRWAPPEAAKDGAVAMANDSPLGL
jgi:hypothetical protein